MMKLAVVKRHALPLFVTLTYPKSYPGMYQEYKADLHKFIIALKYHFPELGLFWKLEFQARGAAHFHILLWGCDCDLAMKLVPQLWHKIAGGGDYNHFLWHIGELPGTNPCVQQIRSWNGVRSYASKYFSKLDESKNKTGRFWGMAGSRREVVGYKPNNDGTPNYDKPIYEKFSNIPFSDLLKIKINMQSALDFKRSFVRAKGFSIHRLGFWSYGYSPDWLVYLDYLENKNNQGWEPEHPRWLRPTAPPDLDPELNFFI